jgi:hypothetical protein
MHAVVSHIESSFPLAPKYLIGLSCGANLAVSDPADLDLGRVGGRTGYPSSHTPTLLTVNTHMSPFPLFTPSLPHVCCAYLGEVLG